MQAQAFETLSQGVSSLLVAPTGSGKTLAAFLTSIDDVLFSPTPPRLERCRVVYVSPLKALATDVDKNLRAPLAGILEVAEELGVSALNARTWVRTGDTPQAERARFLKHPADIIITTPESLYLLLTSRAHACLQSVHTVIVDEIHALVGSKRGAHLALSLERLESLTAKPPLRIGLSATVTPHQEVARFLGGFERNTQNQVVPRRVQVLAPPMKKALALSIEMPVEAGPSAWEALAPRILEHVLAHTSTLVFVNSRRVAEKLASLLNERAGSTLAFAHHGSVAKPQREYIENQLKSGHVRALVATSSLELGIDMGAVDLVIQVEAPPTVASGLQRLGRAGHQVGVQSTGIIFPKHKADIVASAAAARAMLEGDVEPLHFPVNPLDILAQQIVAAVSMTPWSRTELYARVCCAAPFAELPLASFDSVLELLAGRYVSQDFAALKPRLVWNRDADVLSAREGAKTIAIANAGTIPDRGLYGVFLAGHNKPVRVGELDEEMVFESRVGDVFLLGASSWRIESITLDRVLVSPAFGQPAKMPFWRGDSLGRPARLGTRMGELLASLEGPAHKEQHSTLLSQYSLNPNAAHALQNYVAQQVKASYLPTAARIVVERCKDALGEWRLCVLSPLGGRVLAPWCMAIVAKAKARLGRVVETVYTNDGFVVRLASEDDVLGNDILFPQPSELESLLQNELVASALFAARFRENAARALLLPKRRANQRTPLWVQRKRSQDLLDAAAHFPTFPILTETARECLRDVFDLASLRDVLAKVSSGQVTVVQTIQSTPSPFAASLLFNYAANYLYDGDVPLAERRAQALTLDREHLQDLLGTAELRTLLDPDVILQTQAELSYTTEERRAHSIDSLHNLLLRVGDLTHSELSECCQNPEWASILVREKRAFWIVLAQEERLVAAEDVVRFHQLLGTPLPGGLPSDLRTPVANPARDIAWRFAKTRTPFTTAHVVQRYAWTQAQEALQDLERETRIVAGAFLPNGTALEWCDKEVLARLRSRSLQRLRAQVQPASPEVFTRALLAWQGVTQERRGLDALLDTIGQLQGASLIASELETHVLPARIKDYEPGQLDALLAAGEIVWAGREPLGTRDAKISLYLADDFTHLWTPPVATEFTEQESRVLAVLQARGALHFDDVRQALGGAFAQTVQAALWGLVWKGHVHHDAFFAVRQRLGSRRMDVSRHTGFRSRRRAQVQLPGRWSVLPSVAFNATEHLKFQAETLLQRYGVVWRETLAHQNTGSTMAMMEIYKALETRGKLRRGYFVQNVGAMQFAWPSAVEALRKEISPGASHTVVLAATDPAQPYGALIPWPKDFAEASRRAGAKVVLQDGKLLIYVAKRATKVLLASSISDDALTAATQALHDIGVHLADAPKPSATNS